MSRGIPEGPGIPGSVPPAPDPGRRRRMSPRARNLVEWVVVIAVAVGSTLAIRAWAFQTFYIPSPSMVPTLQVGDRLVVNKLSDDYHRGDIVVFERPDTWQAAHDVLIKRIIALEGETLEIRNNMVYIDGDRLVEPYLPPDVTMPDYGPFTVPDGDVFVMGDNRVDSSDSRANGPVPLSDVIGRAALRIWPFGEFGGL